MIIICYLTYIDGADSENVVKKFYKNWNMLKLTRKKRAE